MIRTVCLAVVLVAIFSALAQAQDLPTSQPRTAASQAQRIANANQEFATALRDTPNKRASVAIFFASDMPAERLRMTLSTEPFRVKAFRHGTAFYSGGYTLADGESLDQAISNYRRDHNMFLRERMRLEEGLAAKESDPELRKAYEEHRKEADHMLQDYEANGLRIVGIEIEGSIRDIDNFRQRSGFVRMVEITRPGVPQPAIVPR